MLTVQHAMHRAHADTHLGGDSPHRETIALALALLFLDPRDHPVALAGSHEAHALGPLELGEQAHHLEERTTCRDGCVYCQPVEVEVHARAAATLASPISRSTCQASGRPIGRVVEPVDRRRTGQQRRLPRRPSVACSF